MDKKIAANEKENSAPFTSLPPIANMVTDMADARVPPTACPKKITVFHYWIMAKMRRVDMTAWFSQ